MYSGKKWGWKTKNIEVIYSSLITEATLKFILSQYIALSTEQEIFKSSSTIPKVLWKEKAGTLPHSHIYIFNQSNGLLSYIMLCCNILVEVRTQFSTFTAALNFVKIQTVLSMTFRYKPSNVKECSRCIIGLIFAPGVLSGWYMKVLFGGIWPGLLIPWPKFLT